MFCRIKKRTYKERTTYNFYLEKRTCINMKIISESKFLFTLDKMQILTINKEELIKKLKVKEEVNSYLLVAVKVNEFRKKAREE